MLPTIIVLVVVLGIGGGIWAYMNRTPKGIDAGISSFQRELNALAPRQRRSQAGASHDPADDPAESASSDVAESTASDPADGEPPDADPVDASPDPVDANPVDPGPIDGKPVGDIPTTAEPVAGVQPEAGPEGSGETAATDEDGIGER